MMTLEQELEIKLTHKCKKCKSKRVCIDEKLESYGIVKHYKCKCIDGEILEKILRK